MDNTLSDNKNNLDKFRGCLIGLACGDYLGMPYETMDVKAVRKFFQTNVLDPVKANFQNGDDMQGYYTDDSSMALCLAESLIDKGFDPKDQFSRYQKWFRGGYETPTGNKAYGVGSQTIEALTKQNINALPTSLTDNPSINGNGALMRCAPVGLLYFRDDTKIVTNSILSAIVTHNSVIPAWSTVVLNIFIAYSLRNIKKESYCSLLLNSIDTLPDTLKTLLKTDFTDINEFELDNSGHAFNTLKIALYSFFTSDSFSGCLTSAIKVGGDTDTQCAVTGALAGSYYGIHAIPKSWYISLARHQYILSVATKLFRKSESNFA